MAKPSPTVAELVRSGDAGESEFRDAMASRRDLARHLPPVSHLPPRLIVDEQIHLAILKVRVAVARDGELDLVHWRRHAMVATRALPCAVEILPVEDVSLYLSDNS